MVNVISTLSFSFSRDFNHSSGIERGYQVIEDEFTKTTKEVQETLSSHLITFMLMEISRSIVWLYLREEKTFTFISFIKAFMTSSW